MVKKDNLKLQLNELENKWKRALADYQNLEKRVIQEKQEFVRFSNAALLSRFLAVLDDLERAEAYLKDQGLTIALNKFRAVLKDEGLEEIKIENQKFDPCLMECMEAVKGKKDMVVQILQKGYLLNKKILRPAKVNVGNGG